MYCIIGCIVIECIVYIILCVESFDVLYDSLYCITDVLLHLEQGNANGNERDAVAISTSCA